MVEEGYGFVVAVTFTLNYIVGTGFLTLPWAFQASGVLLATGVLLFISLLAVCSVLMILESMARAVAVSADSLSLSSQCSQNYSTIPSSNANIHKKMHSNKYNMWEVGRRRIEIVELCELFYPSGRSTFIILLSIYMYGALWAYCTVFANALATALPLFHGYYSYYFYLFLYGIVVVPMSCLELSEQVHIQMFYACCRVFMVIAMLGSVTYAYFQAKYDPTTISHALVNANSVDLCNWSGFKVIVPIALYSNIFHHSLPALSEIVADKKQLSRVYVTTLGICFASYTLIGVALSTYFGSNIMSSSNLNWAEFNREYSSFAWSFISHYIILFPAIDVMSAFPLSAITLGNNIQAFYSSNKNVNTIQYSRWQVILFRCCATIPPIIGACFVADLGVVTTFTGITGFAIIFFYPVVLSYMSNRMLIERGIAPYTYYTCSLTSDIFKLLLILFGIFMVFLTLFTQ